MKETVTVTKAEVKNIEKQIRELCSTNIAARILYNIAEKMTLLNNKHLEEIERLESEVWYLQTCQEHSLCPVCFLKNIEKAKKTLFYSEKHKKYKPILENL